MKSAILKDLITAQKNCFITKCERNCLFCDFKRDPEDILNAYNEVLAMVEGEKGLKKEFFNSGIEYSKAEFAKLIEKEKDRIGELHKDKEIDDLAYAQVLGLQRAIELTESIRKK